MFERLTAVGGKGCPELLSPAAQPDELRAAAASLPCQYVVKGMANIVQDGQWMACTLLFVRLSATAPSASNLMPSSEPALFTSWSFSV